MQESQIVKIQLGDNTKSDNYILMLAETVEASGSEIFFLLQLPLLNPAGAADCEIIAKTLSASLKRSYQREIDSQDFEKTIDSLNAEINKLPNWGLDNWHDKLNCAIVVKSRNTLWATSTGTITILLLRDGEFLNLADTSPTDQSTNRKFASYIDGKLSDKDILIVGTSNIFELANLSTVKSILTKEPFFKASKTITDLITTSVRPDTSAAMLLAYQSVPQPNMIDYKMATFATPQIYTQTTKTDEVQKSWLEKIDTTELKSFGKYIATVLNPSFLIEKYKLAKKQPVSHQIPQSSSLYDGQLQHRSKYKRIVRYSVIFGVILIVGLVSTNLYLSKKRKLNEENQAKITQQVSGIISKLEQLSLANSSSEEAEKIFDEVGTSIQELKTAHPDLTEDLNSLNQKLSNAIEQKNKVAPSIKEDLKSLEFTPEQIIPMGSKLVVFGSGSSKTYDPATGTWTNLSLCDEKITQLVGELKPGQLIAYSGSNLFICDTLTQTITSRFTQAIPPSFELGGIAYFNDSQKIYAVSKPSKLITSFDTIGVVLKSSTWAEDSALSSASSLAIDGALYALTDEGVIKFASGKRQDFTQPQVYKKLKSGGKLYTTAKLNYLYILDTVQNRIIICDKSGYLINSIIPDIKDQLTSFWPDEKNKIIYATAGDKVIKITY